MKVKQLFEGISNIGGTLIQDVTKFYNEKMFRKNLSISSTLKFQKIYTIKNNNILLNINIKLINDTGVGSATIIDKQHNVFIIEIHVKSYFFNPTLIHSAIVHELGHVSQTYNGALRYNQDSYALMAKVEQVPKMDYYYAHHTEFSTEQESNLLSLFQIIKEKQYQQAANFLLDRLDYLKHFTYKQFIKKAFEFGLKNSDLVEFKKIVYNMKIPKELQLDINKVLGK